MPRVIDVSLERLDAQAFAPFGEIVGPGDRPPVFSGPHIESWRLGFACVGAVELMYARYVHQTMAFTCLERHLNVAQCFIPLGNSASVMVVAPTGPEADPPRPPAPDSVRAFLIPGDRGILLHRGTWHALTRFPAQPPGAAFALLTSADTQAELEREHADGTAPRLTDVVDYAAEMDVALEVVDPHDLISGAVARAGQS